MVCYQAANTGEWSLVKEGLARCTNLIEADDVPDGGYAANAWVDGAFSHDGSDITVTATGAGGMPCLADYEGKKVARVVIGSTETTGASYASDQGLIDLKAAYTDAADHTFKPIMITIDTSQDFTVLERPPS